MDVAFAGPGVKDAANSVDEAVLVYFDCAIGAQSIEGVGVQAQLHVNPSDGGAAATDGLASAPWRLTSTV